MLKANTDQLHCIQDWKPCRVRDRQLLLLDPTLLGPFKHRQPPLWRSLLTASANRPISVKVNVLYYNTGLMLRGVCSHH